MLHNHKFKPTIFACVFFDLLISKFSAKHHFTAGLTSYSRFDAYNLIFHSKIPLSISQYD